MVAPKLLFRAGKPVGSGLLFIIFCVLSARSATATEGHLENANDLTKNSSIDEAKNSAIEADFDGENVLLEVLGDEAFDQNEGSEVSISMFNDLDLDKNGLLSREEFSQHYEEILGRSTSSSSYTDGTNTTPQSAASALLLDDVTLAWHEFDTDGDGSVSASEWSAIMFHEEPQVAQYRDGEAVASDDADDATHRRVLFRDWDRDRSGRLDRAELRAMLAGGGDGPASLSAGELDMVLYQLFDDHDKDGDGELTAEEWIHGEVY
uniref:EF-hand domain-containing protein n=1 Tax=Cryptomonas curvata TaxID=233186 RepID=A0A7S0M292_9CRYP|mmetsp:Transcript_21521/g.45213  ORF Transcript_21521/g.45213 Transcript_21521/m.45213 type:complete len:264 (+) Transcript_21521:113-904(+)